MLVGGRAGFAARVDCIAMHLVAKTGLADPDTAGGLSDRVSLRDQIQGSTPELRRVGSRHLTDSFRDDHRLNSGVRETESGSERAWGRYWGWHTREVWTFIIWVLFAGYIHARATRGWRGDRSAWLAIIGFSAVIFNYTVVNIAFKGLHSYSGL